MGASMAHSAHTAIIPNKTTRLLLISTKPLQAIPSGRFFNYLDSHLIQILQVYFH